MNNALTTKLYRIIKREYGVTKEQLFTRCKKRPIIDARQLFTFILRTFTDMTYPMLGEFMGKHHTTIIYEVKAVQERMEAHPDYREFIARIIREIKTV